MQIVRLLYCYMYCNMCNIQIILLYVLQYVPLLRQCCYMYCNMCKFIVSGAALCEDIDIILVYVHKYLQILTIYYFIYCRMCKYWDTVIYVVQYVQIFRLNCYMYCNMFQYWDNAVIYTAICVNLLYSGTAICANIDSILLCVLKYLQILRLHVFCYLYCNMCKY